MYKFSVTGTDEVNMWLKQEAEQEAPVHEATTPHRTEEPKGKE